MNLDELKEKLSDIKADNYLPGNADIGELITEMMRNIGSADYVDTYTAGTRHENIRKFLRSLYLAAGDRGMKDIADAALNVLGNI